MGEKHARLAFGLLCGAGWAGAHRFYLQRYASAAGQLLLTALMVALWIWGGDWARYAPYGLGPIVLWLVHDGFWLSDYFRVEEDMDTQLAGFVDAESASPMSAAATSARTPTGKSTALGHPSALPAQALADAPGADDVQMHKKSRAILLTHQQIAASLQDHHPEAAHIAAERLVKYLQQRSRRPQHDPHLAEAYLLQGQVFYQTQYADAARKKLQMGVHLGAPFAHLSAQVQQAQGWLEQLRNPPLRSAPGVAVPAIEPGQYEALMNAGHWAQAYTLCTQTIALRESAKTVDVADLARHHVNAMDIAQQLGRVAEQRIHGQMVLQLAQHAHPRNARQSLVPVAVQRQALERLGDMAYAQAEHAQATPYYQDALVLAVGAQASAASICGLLQRLALNFERGGHIDQALECWRAAAGHIQKIGDVTEDAEAVSDVLTRYAAFSIRHQPAQVKPLIEQSLRIQHKAYRGFSMAAARAYEVFACFMLELRQPGPRAQHLRQALLLVQICEPDNSAHMAQLKQAIAASDAAAAAQNLAKEGA